LRGRPGPAWQAGHGRRIAGRSGAERAAVLNGEAEGQQLRQPRRGRPPSGRWPPAMRLFAVSCARWLCGRRATDPV